MHLTLNNAKEEKHTIQVNLARHKTVKDDTLETQLLGVK